MSRPAEFFRWANHPMQEMHYYRVTEAGILHVNTIRFIVSALPVNAVPSLAEKCTENEFNNAKKLVWEQFNAIQ